jgi:hypothetical protein
MELTEWIWENNTKMDVREMDYEEMVQNNVLFIFLY